MKHMKKLAGILLALVMVLTTLAVPAFAAEETKDPNTITVNNAKPGETYTAYQMLELVVNDPTNPTAYVYTVNAAWADFFAESNKAVWGTVLERDEQGYFTAKTGIESETEWVGAAFFPLSQRRHTNMRTIMPCRLLLLQHVKRVKIKLY